jgi:hypothetical protein
MTPIKRITPAGIMKNLPRIQQSEPPYNWAKQTRRELVERELLAVKELAPRAQELPPTGDTLVRKRLRKRKA